MLTNYLALGKLTKTYRLCAVNFWDLPFKNISEEIQFRKTR